MELSFSANTQEVVWSSHFGPVISESNQCQISKGKWAISPWAPGALQVVLWEGEPVCLIPLTAWDALIFNNRQFTHGQYVLGAECRKLMVFGFLWYGGWKGANLPCWPGWLGCVHSENQCLYGQYEPETGPLGRALAKNKGTKSFLQNPEQKPSELNSYSSNPVASLHWWEKWQG